MSGSIYLTELECKMVWRAIAEKEMADDETVKECEALDKVQIKIEKIYKGEE